VHEAWTGTGSIAFAEARASIRESSLPVKRVIQELSAERDDAGLRQWVIDRPRMRTHIVQPKNPEMNLLAYTINPPSTLITCPVVTALAAWRRACGPSRRGHRFQRCALDVRLSAERFCGSALVPSSRRCTSN